MVLIDREKDIRGKYQLSIEEIDRAIIETKLLITLTKDGATSSGR
jgi:hypothetical protein